MDQGLFVSRAELEHYLKEVTPLKKGAATEALRIRTLLRHPLAQRIIATLRGVDIARYLDERLKQVSPATVKRVLVILSYLFEVTRKEWGIQVHNPVRDIKLSPNNKPRDRKLQTDRDGKENEEVRLLKACRKARNPYLLPIIRLALETAR